MSLDQQIFLNSPSRVGRISLKEKIFFLRYLGLLLQAGFPLVQALSLMQTESHVPTWAHVIQRLKLMVEQGKPFSVALKKFPRHFNAFQIAIVQIGEYSGRLDELLILLSNHMNKILDYRQKLMRALLYPGFVLITFLIMLGVLFEFVIPEFNLFYQNLNVPMPMLTQCVLSFSQHFMAFLLLSIVILCGWVGFLGSFKVPIIGALIHQITLIRLSLVLHVLLRAGIPLTQGLSLAAQMVTQVRLKQALSHIQAQVKQGKMLSTGMEQHDSFFKGRLTQMVKLGEESGRLEEMLHHYAQLGENDIDHYLNKIMGLIEPILLIFLSLWVGLVVVSVYYPIIKFVNFM